MYTCLFLLSHFREDLKRDKIEAKQVHIFHMLTTTSPQLDSFSFLSMYSILAFILFFSY